MSIKTRLDKLEEKHNPPREKKIYVMIYDPETGRVKYGSPELIGMTREEVNAHIGGGIGLNVVYIPDNKRQEVTA